MSAKPTPDRLPAHAGQMEPLVPAEHVAGPLHALAAQLIAEGSALVAMGRPLQPAMAELLRQMNSYYTNRIEGQHTTPLEIERALRGQFDATPDLARRQRLAVAHIECERDAEARLVKVGGLTDGWRPAFAEGLPRDLHRDLYTRLPEADRVTEDGDVVAPGEYRVRDVEVGRHVPPPYASVPMLLHRWSDVYGGQPPGQHAIIGIAAAHHRLTWIHPFRDGNGRVSRLQTHLALHGMGLTGGVWSPLRGFARTHRDYYGYLAAADAPRDDDTDGRGSLSQRALVQWVDYVLRLCLDQVLFMAGQLQFDGVRGRAEALVRQLSGQRGSGLTPRALPAVLVVLTGNAPRARLIGAMVGHGTTTRTAERELTALVRAGLLASIPTPEGHDRREQWFRFAVPIRALPVLFPALWPEAEANLARGE